MKALAVVRTVALSAVAVAALGIVGQQDIQAEQQEQQIQQTRQSSQPTPSSKDLADTAYSICIEAHRDTDSPSEAACGEALDAAGMTFLCEYPNGPDSYCWVESKE